MLFRSLLGNRIIDLFILPENIKHTGIREDYYLKICMLVFHTQIGSEVNT